MGFINENGTYWRKDAEFEGIFEEEPKQKNKYNYFDSCLDLSKMPEGNANNAGLTPDTINFDDIF